MTDFKIEKIAPLCADFGVTLDSEKINLLNLYGNLLLLWNEKINLTAITEPEEVLYKHFYDCILFLKHIKVPQNAARLLGTEKPIIICETLTGNEQRAFVISKKISQTPTKYPRKPADISKQPL